MAKQENLVVNLIGLFGTGFDNYKRKKPKNYEFIKE